MNKLAEELASALVKLLLLIILISIPVIAIIAVYYSFKNVKADELKASIDDRTYYQKTGKIKKDLIRFSKNLRNTNRIISIIISVPNLLLISLMIKAFIDSQQIQLADIFGILLFGSFFVSIIYTLTIGVSKKEYYFLEDRVIFGQKLAEKKFAKITITLTYDELIRIRDFKDGDIYRKNSYTRYYNPPNGCYVVETKFGNFYIFKKRFTLCSRERLSEKVKIDIPQESFTKWYE